MKGRTQGLCLVVALGSQERKEGVFCVYQTIFSPNSIVLAHDSRM